MEIPEALVRKGRRVGSGGCQEGFASENMSEPWLSQVGRCEEAVEEAEWWNDEELLALELQDLQSADFDLSLTGFDPGELDGLLALDDEERANSAPPLPGTPTSRLGDLWCCGKH